VLLASVKVSASNGYGCSPTPSRAPPRAQICTRWWSRPKPTASSRMPTSPSCSRSYRPSKTSKPCCPGTSKPSRAHANKSRTWLNDRLPTYAVDVPVKAVVLRELCSRSILHLMCPEAIEYQNSLDADHLTPLRAQHLI
jgi:hypothetical protein